MKSFAYRRILALVITCFLLCSAAAAYAETALVMKDATVYSSAKTSSKKLGKLEAGTKLELVAEKSGWAKVELNGNVGYMDADAVAEYKTYDGKKAYTTESTAMYKSFSTSSKKLDTIPKDEKVSISATAGSWARVSYDGKTGFVKLSKLTSEAPAKKDDFDSYTAYAKADDTKVYNSKGKVISKVDANTKVTVVAEKDDLCKVERNGATAYMKKSSLSTSKVETFESYTAYAKADDTKVYNADGKTIGKVEINTKVTVVAEKDDLCKVERNGATAYMKKSTLSTSKVSEGKDYVVQYGDKGEAVTKIQERLKELGYFTGTVGGNYLDLTKAAVAAFQDAADLSTTGICDEKTLNAMFSDNAPKKQASKKEESGDSTATPATGTAKAMDWWTSDIQSIFSRGTIATVTDVSTGIAWKEKRTGGTNHADVQPVTAADTAAMKKAVGSWSWNRRAIFVTINGVNYAASMNCMPHGGDSISDNNFDGHHCIHFTNSRTHGTNSMCSLHQAAIKKAANATL